MVVKGSARDKLKTKEGLSYTKPHMLEPPRAGEGVFRHIHWFRLTSQPIAVAVRYKRCVVIFLGWRSCKTL